VNLSWSIALGVVAVALCVRLFLNVRRLGRVNAVVPVAAV
jgi:hypothetical protein